MMASLRIEKEPFLRERGVKSFRVKMIRDYEADGSAYTCKESSRLSISSQFFKRTVQYPKNTGSFAFPQIFWWSFAATIAKKSPT